VHKSEKERVVSELTERLKSSETLIVADYRGLTMTDIDGLRGQLLEHGAKFTVVKNTLGRIAAKESGNDALLALLEGPTAIAFLEADGDMVAVAKALSESARTTRVLTIRGGVLQGKVISGDEVGELAKLPPVDVLRGQVLAAIIAPLTSLIGLVTAPLQNLVGLIDARIEQLEAGGDTSAAAPSEPEAEAEAAAPAEEPAAEAEPAAEVEPEAEAEAEAEPEAVVETATEEESTVEEDAEASTSENQEEE
jgi:large subunit ribosomal protein L10